MPESQDEIAASGQRRDRIQTAAGVLMERYDVSGATAERALMDWSRVTGIGVYDLARMVLADAEQRRELDR